MLFLSLSFFLILSFSLFSFLSASYSTSIDDDGQQVNTRKNETKRKEEEGEIRGHEVLFFSFSPAKQQVLFGNEWRTSREKKRDRLQGERGENDGHEKKAIQNPLSWNLKIFQLYIFMSLYSTKKET